MSILENKLTLPFVLPNTFPAPVNKVVVKDEILIDLTTITVTPDKVLKGVTFINSKGEIKTGTYVPPTN
nr:MAG TPA: hypothetical protein [Caudoviricetes sp.]